MILAPRASRMSRMIMLLRTALAAAHQGGSLKGRIATFGAGNNCFGEELNCPAEIWAVTLLQSQAKKCRTTCSTR